jgi:hypothetical protein
MFITNMSATDGGINSKLSGLRFVGQSLSGHFRLGGLAITALTPSRCIVVVSSEENQSFCAQN